MLGNVKDDVKYSVSEWFLKVIEKSSNKLFKYKAFISNGNDTVVIYFGACSRDAEPYEHFCDRTGLKLYSEFDNYDPIRSRAWYLKNKEHINSQFYNSKGLEYTFLQKIT